MRAVLLMVPDQPDVDGEPLDPAGYLVNELTADHISAHVQEIVPTADMLREFYTAQHPLRREHETHTIEEWACAVGAGDTLRGYWEWLSSRLEQEKDERDTSQNEVAG